MNCLEFRRTAGADPERLDAEALAHSSGCPQCAQFREKIRLLDATILKALQVPAGSSHGMPQDVQPRIAEAIQKSVGSRNRWYALAASIAGGVAVGTLLWAGGSHGALAKDAVEHLRHEGSSMAVSHIAADAGVVRAVLARDGVRLRSDVGLVTYVMSCSFRGHEVPHLVVQTSGGPVTVLVLRDEKVSRASRFHERGYAGTLVPSGPGSIAVIGATDPQVKEAAARMETALEWMR